MTEFGTTLTALLDEVAGTIDPRPNFDAVLHGEITEPVANVTPRRPVWRMAGLAAASVALIAGAVVTVDYVVNRKHDSVASRDDELPALFDPAWYGLDPAYHLADGSRASTNEPGARPGAAPTSTEPTETTTTAVPAPATSAPPAASTTPVAAASAAKLGWSSTSTDPIKQSLYGTASPNERVTVTSAFGDITTRADRHGEWSTVLVLRGVPWGTSVPIVVTLTTSGTSFAFEVVRPPEPTTTTSTTTTTPTTEPPAPPTTVRPVEQPAPTEPKPEPTQPAPTPFTSNLRFGDLAAAPMKQGFAGTGTPGSVVHAESQYGSADAVVGPKGFWELALKMYEVPVGTAVGVRITNNASDGAFEYTLVKQAPPAPPEIEFTAGAAFDRTDAAVPFDEFSGRSTTGATITISSPYGGGQATSNGDGTWAARIEFPNAPPGETFTITVTSSKSSAVYYFQLTRTGD